MTRRRHACLACRGKRERWQKLCDLCFGRLPGDLKRGMIEARRSRDVRALADAAARGARWLKEHRPEAVIAARCGDKD